MPTQIFVAGPTTIKSGTDVIGYTDNDNLPSIQFTEYFHEVKVVNRGATPAEIVTQGVTARISLALVKWDQAVVNNLLTSSRGGNSAAVSGIGARLVNSGSLFPISITGVTHEYTFSNCYFAQDGVQDSQWGNRERVLTLNILAIPGDDDILYTYGQP